MNNITCYNSVCTTEDGIILKFKNTDIHIYFEECARNYAAEKGMETSKCVGSRDITTLSFTFYTQPKTRIVFKKRFLMDIISSKSAVSKFLDLQKAIVRAGYLSYDLS